MTPEQRVALQQRIIRTLNDCRQAERVGLRAEAQKHWEEHVRLLLLEIGKPVPASLAPGAPEPTP